MQVESLSRDNEQLNVPVPITDLCKRVRFRQSQCSICVDICSVDAITFPLGPEISENCIGCGLCQVACPTEAFEGALNADQMLVDLLHFQEDGKNIKHNLYMHCSQAEADNNHSLALNCLGNLTENALLAVTGSAVEQLLATTGRCSECSLNQGKLLFDKAAQTYAQLSTMVPFSKVKVAIREKPYNQKQQKPCGEASTKSRREFFRTITDTVVKQAANVVVKKEQQVKALLQNNVDTIEQRKRLSPQREVLRELLDGLRGDSHEVGLGIKIPWKKMVVDEAHCVGCGICVNVCPTGALIKETDSTELTRYINNALCTNCGVCAEACPQDVIRFEQVYRLNDIIDDKLQVIAKVALNNCAICGETIPVSEGEVCTTCQKRQIVPIFM